MYLTLRIGDYCYIGDDAVIESAQIGSRVYIGRGSIIVRTSNPGTHECGPRLCRCT